MITRMQDRPMLCRLTHLSLLVSSLTALCALLSGLHQFFLRCQLLSQISQLPLLLLLKLSNSMQLMVTTGRHLSATLHAEVAKLLRLSGTVCRHLQVLTCMSLLHQNFLSA